MKKTIILISFFIVNNVLAQNQAVSICQAIKNCDIDVTNKILKRDKKAIETVIDNIPPLMQAVESCDLTMVKNLVENGASTKAKGLIYWDSILLDNGNIRRNGRRDDPFGNLTSIAVARNKIDVLHYLIESCGVPIDDKSNSPDEEDVMSGCTAFHWAVYLNRFSFIIYLAEKGANINETTSHGLNALHLSNFTRDADLVSILIELGVDINAQEPNGFTPLMMAIFLNNTEIAEHLIAAGADINLKTKDDITAIQIAEANGNLPIYTLLKESIDKATKPDSDSNKVSMLVRSGHKLWSSTVKFSKDEKYLFSGGYDKKIIAWDVNSGLEIKTYKGLSAQVMDIALSPNNKYVVACSNLPTLNEIGLSAGNRSAPNQTVIMWEISTGNQIRFYPGLLSSNNLIFSPDQKYLIGSGFDQLIIWDAATGDIVSNFNYGTGYTSKLEFSRDGKNLIVVKGDDDGKINVLNFNALLKPEQNIAYEITYIEPGKSAYKAGLAVGDKIIKIDNEYFESVTDFSARIKEKNKSYLFTIQNKTGIFNLTVHKSEDTFGIRYKNSDTDKNPNPDIILGDSVSCFTLIPDSDSIVTGQINGVVKIYNIKTGRQYSSIKAADGLISHISCAPDKSYIAVCETTSDAHSNIKIYDLRTYETICNIDQSGIIASVDFTADSRFFVCSGNLDLDMWEIKNFQKIKNFASNLFVTNCVHFNTNSNFFYSSTLGSVFSWDLRTGNFNYIYAGKDLVTSLNLANSDQFFIFGDENGKVTIWDNVTNKPYYTLETNQPNLVYVNFDPKTKDITTIHTNNDYWLNYKEYEGIIKVWDFKTGQEVKTYKGNFINQLTTDPKRKKICWSIANKKIDLFNLDSQFSFSYESPHALTLEPFALSLDGKYKASTDTSDLISNYSLIITDSQTDSIVSVLRTHNDKIKTVCFSPDNQTIATGSWDNTIKIWNFRTGEVLSTLNAHDYRLRSVRYNDDGKYLISCSYDNTMKLWDIEKNKEICTFMVGENAKHLIYNSEGYYWGSKESFDLVHFVKGMKCYSFEQFDLRLNRPDIILGSLPNGNKELIAVYYKAYQKRLQKLNFTEEMLSKDFHIPEISLAADIPIVIDEPHLKIHVSALDTVVPLDRLNVFINDVPIYGISGINLRPMNTHTYADSLDLSLNNGQNKIQISVLNQAGAESLKETFYITCNVRPQKPDLYLIAVGVSKFQNQSMNLTYPTKDVADFTNFLKQQDTIHNHIFIDTILDASLTVNRLKVIKNKLSQTKVDDHVIILIAGHGIIDDNLDYYLATYDTDFENPKSHAIPYEKLEDLLDSIPARKKLMLVDACHAGEIDKENTILMQNYKTVQGNVNFRSVGPQHVAAHFGLENSFELMKELFVDLRRGTGATVIASAGGIESAMEGDLWNNSVFMYALLNGLRNRNADLNKDGAIMVSELQSWLGMEVEELTNGNQRPVFRAENVSNDWRMW